MESVLNSHALGAISYTLAFVLCMDGILKGGVKGKAFKYTAFFCIILPYMLFLHKPTLFSHEMMALGIILISSLVFRHKLFMSCYMTVVSYLVVSYSMLCAHVLAFAYSSPVDLGRMLTFPVKWNLCLSHLLLTFFMIRAYGGFVNFVKGSFHKTKRDTRTLMLVIGVSLVALLIASNIYLRFLTVYSSELVRIPKLMPVLVCGFAAMVLIAGLFLYLISLTIVSRLHLYEVKEYAERDIQTGVLNRQTGLDTLGARIRDSKLTGKPLTICFVDINNLKQVNDKLGHKAGDQLIEVVTETIRISLRNKDFVCRLGGDEFLITYCDCGLNQAKLAWNRIHINLMKKNEDTEIGFPVSVSYGFSEYNTIESLSVMDFIEQADAAMYANKSKYKQLKKGATQELDLAVKTNGGT